MSAPTPIPTLPITSATAAQSAHIASLTTQLHQLVEKNNILTSKLELAQKEGRERVNEEVRRTDEVVRQMRIAHGEEMKGLKESMETLRISAVHAQQSIAYAHQVTKTDLVLTERALSHQKRQNALQSAALVRAVGAERILQSRFTTSKTSHAIQQQALLAQLEQSRADLLSSQTRSTAQEDKTMSKLKNQLESTQLLLASSQERVKRLEGDKEKMVLDLEASQSALERLRIEFKEERRVRKEVEKELREVKEQLSAKDTLEEARDADAAKVHKRHVRELEVALASEKGRVAELEVDKVELEKEKRKLEKRLERENERMNEREKIEKEMAPLKSGSIKKKDADTTVPAKSKKRPREEEGEGEDGGGGGGGLIIQGAFGVPVDRNEPAKKRKKAKLDESDNDLPKSKPSKSTKSTTTSTSTKATSTSTSTKSKKPPTKSAAVAPPPPSSPPQPSPSPISTPPFSSSDEDAPVVVKVTKKPPPPPPPAAATTTTTTKKKFKVPPPMRDNEPVNGASDSDDFAAKKAKYFGVSTADGATTTKKKEGVKEKEGGDKVATKAKEKGKAKKFAAREDEDEVFDLDAISDTSDGEDIEVLVKKPEGKEVEKSKSQPKPHKVPAESEGSKAPVKKATAATASSKGDKDKADKVDRAKAVEVENAPVPVGKPKKRTFNLLGSTTSNALTGAGLNRFGLFGGGLDDNIYNIPSQLSSPEKGGGLVPRAKFGN